MQRVGTGLIVVTALALSACSGDVGPTVTSTTVIIDPMTTLPDPMTLRTASPDGLVFGSSVVGLGHLAGTETPEPFETDEVYRVWLGDQFGSLTPENQLKWEVVHPERDRYDFGSSDAIVDHAAELGVPVRGHTLMWHSQNPRWLADGEFTDAELEEILHDHITTVVGRYVGRISHWDVANEIFDDDGALRSENPFIGRLGVGVVADAFRWAHEADPEAVLFLNDYNVEGIGPKSDAYLQLAGELLAEGVPLGGFGIQGHLSLQYGFPADLRENMRRFADLGLEVAVTELDVRMPLDGEPSDAQLVQQSDYYRRVVDACLAVETCTSITVWGGPDQYSWVPGFFTDEGAATLFWEDYSPKPAFEVVISSLENGRG